MRPPGLRWITFGGVIAFVALLAYGLAAQAPDRTVDDALAAGTAPRAPEFELDVLTRGAGRSAPAVAFRRAAADGKVALSELRGTPIVLNFWASWCSPCATEAPVLSAGWSRAAPQGVLVLGLNQQDIREDASQFVQRHELRFPHVREGGKETARSYGATGLPETFFIDAAGRIVGHVIGVVERGQFDRGIRAAKGGRVLPPAAGGAVRATP